MLFLLSSSFIVMQAEIDLLIASGIYNTDRTQTTENWDHEARYLQGRELLKKQDDVARTAASIANSKAVSMPVCIGSFGTAHSSGSGFLQSLKHSCRDEQCDLVSLDVGKTFVCPFEYEHNGEYHLHRATGDIYVCKNTGHVHHCTITTCEYQEAQQCSTVSCTLTGRSLGAHLVSVVETDTCFQDSTKRYTKAIAPDMSLMLVNMYDFAKKYESGRAENKEFVSRTSNAIDQLVKTEMTADHQAQRAEILPKPLPLYAATTSGVKMIGFQPTVLSLDDKPLALALTESRHKRKALEYAAESAERSKQRKESSQASAESFLSSLQRSFVTEVLMPEKLERVRAKFTEIVSTFFVHLECAYSLELWLKGIDIATKTAAVTIASLDAKNARQSIFRSDMQYTQALEEFNKATHSCFVGLQYVLEMTQWKPWTSGVFKKKKSVELVDRMLQVWRIIVHSPECTQPFQFNQLANVLLDFVINGLRFDVCLHQTQAMASIKFACDQYEQARCSHKKLSVQFISRDTRMHEIISAPGISQRLGFMCDPRLAGMNTALRLYRALIKIGIPLSELSKWVVKL